MRSIGPSASSLLRVLVTVEAISFGNGRSPRLMTPFGWSWRLSTRPPEKATAVPLAK